MPLLHQKNYRGVSHDVITFKKTKIHQNSHHAGLQRDGSFYGDLGECKKTLRMLLVCVESSEMPLLCKLKELN